MRVLTSNNGSKPIKLLLEDGEVFEGYSFGSFVSSPIVGEVVFNTGMVGYTEALTDPSYAGQILCFTYPLLGNYGVPDYVKDKDGILLNFESHKIQVRGVIAKEVAKRPSHFESRRALSNWLASEGVPGIEGIDTRELTIHLRERGVMLGVLGSSLEDAKKLLEKSERYSEINFYPSVSVKARKSYGKNLRGRIAVIDCGIKMNIVRSLVTRGFEVVLHPYDTKYDEISSGKFQGIVLSNGPGDPRVCSPAIELARNSIDDGIPTLGICLGTQIIALSQGGETFKLKYGHRGQNKPCIDLLVGRCLVTSQNHGFSVDKESLKGTKLAPWFLNADDGTIEGLIHEQKPCVSVQFHPEASPGPVDASYVFDVFSEKINKVN